jgi:hypothetical protein
VQLVPVALNQILAMLRVNVMNTPENRWASSLLILLSLQACDQRAPPDLPGALKGTSKSEFLACSGPPSLEVADGGRDRMAFLTNLQRRAGKSYVNPALTPHEACSVNAVFENNRLVSAEFYGNMAMCDWVFAPCLENR